MMVFVVWVLFVLGVALIPIGFHIAKSSDRKEDARGSSIGRILMPAGVIFALWMLTIALSLE